MSRSERPFRAGPPTPRSERPVVVTSKVCLYSDGCPMDGPVCHLCEHVQGTYHGVNIPDPALGERDAACDKWVDSFHGACSAASKMAAKTAFCAGWATHRKYINEAHAADVNHFENKSAKPD
jgi:hypothetical protein